MFCDTYGVSYCLSIIHPLYLYSSDSDALSGHALTLPSLINVLRSANQPVPEELLKFGTTVKKKTHPIYGAFFREQNADAKTQAKITFDD
jgi:hypothetical protein